MLKLSQRKDSGIWRVRGTYLGVAIDKSTKTRNRADARLVLKRCERQIKDALFREPEEQSYSFAQAVISWIESGNTVSAFPYFKSMLDALGGEELAEITQGTIDKAAIKVMPTQSVATRKRHFYTPVSIILTHAYEERMMGREIKLRRPKVTNHLPRILTPQDAERLIEADPAFAPTLIFLLETGARTSECFSLEWDRVTAKNNKATLWMGKNNRARSVALHTRTKETMPERSMGAVWTVPDTGRDWARSKAGRYHGPATRLARLSNRMGMGRVSVHTLRHTWASWHYSLNKDLLLLKRDGAWDTLEMVERYTHLGSDDLADEIRAYGWFSNPKSGQNTGSQNGENGNAK